LNFVLDIADYLILKYAADADDPSDEIWTETSAESSARSLRLDDFDVFTRSYNYTGFETSESLTVGEAFNPPDLLFDSSDKSSTKDIRQKYILVLVLAIMAYVFLIGALTKIGIKINESHREHQQVSFVSSLPRGNSETSLSERIFIFHFIFLELALFCKLITALIFLMHVITMSSSGQTKSLPLNLLSILYNSSFVCLYIACSLSLYKWITIVIRVTFFGG